MPIRIAPGTFRIISTTIATKPATASSTCGSWRAPILSGTSGARSSVCPGAISAAAGRPAAPLVTMPVWYRPMSARNSPIPAAKLCFMLAETALASFDRTWNTVSSRKTMPATNTEPRRCSQVAPSATRPKAMKAFSPM